MIDIANLVELLVYAVLLAIGMCIGFMLTGMLLWLGASPWLAWPLAPIGGSIGMIVARRLVG